MRYGLLMSVAIALLSSQAHARILDDFSQGSIELTVQLAGDDVSTGLNPARTIGGERKVGAGGQASIRINSPAHPGELGATFPLGLPFHLAHGEFTYGANLPLGANLHDDGAKGFEVAVAGAYGAMYLENALLTLTWLDGGGAATTASREFNDIVSTGPGMTTGRIPFSAFGDLSNVSQISLRFDRTLTPGGLNGPFFSVRSFVTSVPEPATVSLAFVSMIFLMSRVPSAQRRG